MTVHTIVLDVPRPAMTSNDQRRWHWTKVRRAKADMQTRVWAAVKQARIPTLTAPTRVSVTWYAPNAIRRDSDALGPFLKAALDALVAANVIGDDDRTHVLGTSMAVDIDRVNPRIELQLTEENQQ